VIALWIIGWAIIVAIAVALAFFRAVGAGLGRPPSPLVNKFIAITLWPGAKLDQMKPQFLLPIAWLTWTVIGATVIAAIRLAR
jgi:hypothetical protein